MASLSGAPFQRPAPRPYTSAEERPASVVAAGWRGPWDTARSVLPGRAPGSGATRTAVEAQRGFGPYRAIDVLKNFRAHVFRGSVTATAIRLRLRVWIRYPDAVRCLSPFSGMIFMPDTRP
ncbi:hypothetical protein NKH18_17290 [Streptomyces sp. M10(2022)]